MSTKANIISLINTDLASGSNIEATEHRNVLHTNENSLLEAMYGDVITDNNLTETITTSNADFEYAINVNQIGRNITVSGFIRALNTVEYLSNVFSFQGNNYETGGKAYHTIGYKSNSYSVMPLRINGNNLDVMASIFSGEEYRFTITYAKNN